MRGCDDHFRDSTRRNDSVERCHDRGARRNHIVDDDGAQAAHFSHDFVSKNLA
jgi:hypothetical protein